MLQNALGNGTWDIRKNFFPLNHGFDEYFGILYSNDMRPVQLIENMDTIEYPVDQNFLTKRYTDQAIDFIKRKQEKPFFLHLCHAMPHKPLAVSDDYFTPDTPDDLYADVIRELDWSVGEVISALKELGILENTIVIFMSDNGPWYGGSTGGFKGNEGHHLGGRNQGSLYGAFSQGICSRNQGGYTLLVS